MYLNNNRLQKKYHDLKAFARYLKGKEQYTASDLKYFNTLALFYFRVEKKQEQENLSVDDNAASLLGKYKTRLQKIGNMLTSQQTLDLQRGAAELKTNTKTKPSNGLFFSAATKAAVKAKVYKALEFGKDLKKIFTAEIFAALFPQYSKEITGFHLLTTKAGVNLSQFDFLYKKMSTLDRASQGIYVLSKNAAIITTFATTQNIALAIAVKQIAELAEPHAIYGIKQSLISSSRLKDKAIASSLKS